MSDKQHYCYKLSLTLKTPFLSQKSGAQHFGYDMSMLKDENGQPVFLGSQIRGNLRHALEHFRKILENHPKQAEVEQVLSWFGDSSDKNDKENFDPIRARFNFAYYWQLSEADKDKIKNETLKINNEPRYRIGIDKEKGTVKKGNLQVIESVFKSGLSVEFCGKISAQLTKEQAKIAEYWLNKSAQFIPAIGALKGTGFGKMEGANLKKIEATTPVIKANINSDTNRFGITLTLDRPFCIAQPHLPDSNRFVSREYIAGNILLGAIANHYLAESEKKNPNSWFNKIRITHALPAPQNKPRRLPVLPLSLALFGNDLVDLALINPHKHVFLLKDKDHSKVLNAPTFQIDWKEKIYDLAHKQLCKAEKICEEIKKCEKFNKDFYKNCSCVHTSHQRHLVVHTAIAEGTVQADDGKLFSLECIDPKQDIWCADVDLSQIDPSEKNYALELFKQVLNGGLTAIGKTKANATLKLEGQAFLNLPTKFNALDDKYFIVTLQTDARLFAPHQIQATNGQADLFDLYKTYWENASNKQLTLSHYYAQQQRVGGLFHWRYYQKGECYQPQWLTNAGSVFVLEKAINADNGKVQDLLKEWLVQGLPQSQTKDAEKSTWKNNPLIRENGFGEVLINAAVHQQLKVNEDEGEWL